MSKSMILVTADRVQWDKPEPTTGGGLQQDVRLFEGTECKVVMQIRFAPGSEAVKAWEEQTGMPVAGVPVVNNSSIRSEVQG